MIEQSFVRRNEGLVNNDINALRAARARKDASNRILSMEKKIVLLEEKIDLLEQTIKRLNKNE